MKQSFRFKLTITLAALAFIPLLITSIIFYRTSVNTLIKSCETTVRDKLTVSSLQLNVLYSDLFSFEQIWSNLSDSVEMVNQKLNQGNYSSFASSEKAAIYRGWKETVINTLRNYIQSIGYRLFDLDYSFYVYYPKHNLLFDTTTTFYSCVQHEDCSRFFNAYAEGWFTNTGIRYYYQNRNTFITNEKQYISYSFPIYAANDNTPIAYACFNLNNKLIDQLYSIDSLPQEFTLALNDGEILYTKKNDVPFHPISHFFSNIKDDTLEISLPVGNDFTVTSRIPYSVILKDFNDRISRFSWIAIALILLYILAAFVTAQKLYQPLNTLHRKMSAVSEGILTTRISDIRNDEYGFIFSSFNNMLDHIDSLIKNVTSEKVLRAESEVLLLQEQMNPHFIYNSLETIYSLAKLNEIETIPLITKSLSNYYRLSLSGGASDVPLNSAMQISENYVTIQNIRFNNIIDFSSDIPKNMYTILVPKYSIQIFVENAIVHGIKTYNHQTHIHVSAVQGPETITITVTDDGIGIREEKIIELNNQFSALETEKTNFALCNLNRQIKIKYGSNYGVKISRLPDGGTKSQITIPSGG